jgi:hypothetical protein
MELMDVILDGEHNFAIEGAPESVLSVLGALDQFLQDRGRAMVHLTLDGEMVYPSQVNTRFSAMSPSEINRIEVQSASLEELVGQSIAELEDALPELPAACRRLAEVFHGEAPEDGFEPFNELARIWEHVKAQQARIAAVLQIDLKTLEVDGQPVSELHAQLNEFLVESVAALEAGDCVLLGDLLEYELAPRAERELELVALLKAKVAPG